MGRTHQQLPPSTNPLLEEGVDPHTLSLEIPAQNSRPGHRRPPEELVSFVQEKKPRAPKESQRKPDGVSRDVYALTGGNSRPPMPTFDVSLFKRRPQNPENKENITWQWFTFTSSAQTDTLNFYREWTKEETDQLFDLFERFDLRFIVITDRFPTTRSIEELKSRYYAVSRAVLLARAPSPGVVSGHPLVKTCRNLTMWHTRLNASGHCQHYSLKQSNKKEERLRLLLKLNTLWSYAWVAKVLKMLNHQ